MAKAAFMSQKPWVQSHKIQETQCYKERRDANGRPCFLMVFLLKIKLLSPTSCILWKWTVDVTQQMWQLCYYQTKHRPVDSSKWLLVLCGSQLSLSDPESAHQGLSLATWELHNAACHQISCDFPVCPENEFVCFACSWENRYARLCDDLANFI